MNRVSLLRNSKYTFGIWHTASDSKQAGGLCCLAVASEGAGICHIRRFYDAIMMHAYFIMRECVGIYNKIPYMADREKMDEVCRRRRQTVKYRGIRNVVAAMAVLCLIGCGDGREDAGGVEALQKEETAEKETEFEPVTEEEPGGEQTALAVKEESENKEEEAKEEELLPLELSSEDWGLGFGEAGTQPTGNAAVSALKPYHAYYMGEENEKIFYLTFDCGYENGNTEPILDALKKHQTPATFFVVGHFLESAPELVKRMAAEGHAVGNHTWHHPDMATVSQEAVFRKELEDVEKLFREITGKELARYYRPPAGKCVEENLKMAKELGYDTIFWSLAYVDWEEDAQPSHEEAFDKLTGRIHPGAVVLLHNTSQTNGEILDELLTRWEEMGYEMRPLSELVE